MAAIDQCSCGMLQLHLGAFTVRLAPCAAEELLATLNAAIARRGAGKEQDELALASRVAGPRGQA